MLKQSTSRSHKTKPSSKANHPIEDAYFHQSHLKGRQDYGHQAVGVMLSCNGITLNYDIILYDKSVSKIDFVIRSVKGIKRFWLISSLAYLIACCESNSFDFSEGYHILMKKVEYDQLENLYFIARKFDDFKEFMESAS